MNASGLILGLKGMKRNCLIHRGPRQIVGLRIHQAFKSFSNRRHYRCPCINPWLNGLPQLSQKLRDKKSNVILADFFWWSFKGVLSFPLPLRPRVSILVLPASITGLASAPSCSAFLSLQWTPSSFSSQNISPAISLASLAFPLHWVIPTRIPTCSNTGHLKKIPSTSHPCQNTVPFLSFSSWWDYLGVVHTCCLILWFISTPLLWTELCPFRPKFLCWNSSPQLLWDCIWRKDL